MAPKTLSTNTLVVVINENKSTKSKCCVEILSWRQEPRNESNTVISENKSKEEHDYCVVLLSRFFAHDINSKIINKLSHCFEDISEGDSNIRNDWIFCSRNFSSINETSNHK